MHQLSINFTFLRKSSRASDLLHVGLVGFYTWCTGVLLEFFTVSPEDSAVSLLYWIFSFLYPVFLFLGLCLCLVERILQWFLRKDPWVLIFWNFALLNMSLFHPLPVSLAIQFHAGNDFPPENWKGCLLASSVALRRRKLFSFFIFSIWKLRECSLSSQFGDISRWRALVWVYFYLLCWALGESLKSGKLFFGSMEFSWIILWWPPPHFYILSRILIIWKWNSWTSPHIFFYVLSYFPYLPLWKH